MKKRFNKFLTLLAVLLLGFGQMWGAYAPENNPATKTYGEITFLDVANTKANGKITKTGATFEGDSTLAYSLRYVGQTLAVTTWYNCSDGSPASNFESSPTYADAEINGFVAPSSSSGNIGYGGAKAHSGRVRYFYATGITSVAIISHDNGSSKYVQLKIEEVASDGTLSAVTTIDSPNKSSSTLSLIEYTTALNPSKYYKISCTSNTSSNCKVYQIRFGKYIAPTTTYTVTYKAGDGTGTDVVDNDAKTVKAFADCSFTAPSGYEFKEWQDGSSNVVAEGATVSTDMTLTAIYRLIPTKYTVTYDLNGAPGDAPTETNKAEGDEFTLASAPSWAGHAFDGWLCSADAAVKAAGSSYTMTAANTTFTAQWHEVDCKIYSLTGAIGSAEVTAGTATVSADALVLGNSAARIKLTPATGETFKSGDVITISGAPGNIAKKFSAYVYAANGSTKLATLTVANAGDLPLLSGTLSGDADYVFLARIDGTTQNIYTCEVHRSCAEGTAAGLSYATGAVAKLTTDAAFTNPLTNANSLYVAGYGSSDPTVATVDAAGQVTIVGAGSATITAYSATQTKAGTLYAAGTASYTLTVTAPPTYAVTYAANGGEGTMIDPNSPYLEGAEVTLLANAFTAPTSQEFDAWVVTETVSGDPVSVSAGKFTMPAVDVTVTATWRAVTEKYTVIFKDGETTLDTKLFEVGSNPSDADIDKTKPLFAFAAWQKDAADIALDDEFWATVVKDASVTLTARWTKVYAQDADLEGLVESEGTGADWQAYLSGKGYGFSTSNVTLDAKNVEKAHANWPYQGLKAKEVGAYVEGRIAADKLVIIKLGHMAAAANVSLDGVAAGTATGLDADEPAGQLNYFYVENESVLRYETTDGGACVLKAITITNPFQVTFNANGGDPVASQYGHPAVTLPDASNGTKSLLGWFDAAEGGNKIGDVGESYTPAADIELFAQWEDVSTDARLASITLDPSTGVLSPAFDPEVVNYTYTMPYGTAAVPTIAGATSVSAKAKTPVIDAQAANWNDVAHIHGVAESDDTKDYYITMKIEPKDGVSIIKVATTGGTNKTVTGLYAGDGDVSLSSSTKMDNGKYIGFTLDGTTLQAGDRINVHTTEAGNTAGSHIIFYDNMTDKNELYDTEEIGGTGDNIFTINAAMVGKASAYVYRSNADAAHKWNGYVDFIEVTRAINPVLTAITIDGRAGEIDEVNKTVTVSFPYESDLASLDVQPTIVWNGAGSAAPLAAWAEGANTYRITDKDGDYTDYTVTLTRDDLKFAVTFNTHGGSAVEPQNVKDGESPVLPTEPTKEDYLFQGWAETDGGAIVDVTSFTITAAKEFHAIWAPDGAIKLLDGATVNTTNFITGVTATTVNFDDADHNCVIFAGTVSGVNGVKDLDRVIAYNATTTQTRIQLSLHNTSTNNRQVYVKGVVEGSTDVVDIASITLGNQETVTTAYYNFDNASNRTIYIIVPNSAGNVCFLQVKVIETGTALPMFGQAGYSMNLNKGRIFGRAPGAISNFEGMHVESLGSDYQPTSSTVGRFALGTSISFDVTSNVLMSITAANNKTYYVTKGAAGTDNETSKQGVSEFELTAGTWFITAGAEDMQFTNIAFMLPKCAEPAFNSLVNSDVCEGDPYVALNGTATVADAGVPTYQWYKEDNTPIDGATNAEYTPTEDGKYYVIAVNHLDGFSDNEKKSELVSVASVASTVINEAPKNVRKDAGEAATLTVDASGKNLHYAWKESEAIDGTYTDVAGADDAASLDVIVPTGVKFYKVVITSDCGEAIEAIAKVEEWTELPQLDVTASMTWDWTYAGENNKLVTGKNVEIVMANIRENDKIPTNDATFRSQALLFYGENVRATEGGRNYASIGHIAFHTTVPGVVIVEFSDNGSNNRRVSINGKLSEASAAKTDVKTFSANVPAGDVTIMGVEEDGSGSNKYIRISKIEFVKVDYTRPVTAGRLGTICLPNGGKMYGAGLYEIAYFDATAKKIFFDEIINGEMIAGRPYIFLPNEGVDLLAVAYTDNADADAGNYKGLYGSYTQEELGTDGSNYILLNNQYCRVVEAHTYVGANRAYIKLGEIGTTPYAAAPGRRRISMGVTGENQAQGFENLQSGDQPMKVMIDGTLYIIRGEKVFDATGRLVK